MSDDWEICTVKEILSRRSDGKGRVEYLVSWVEEGKGETWEGIENLYNVQLLLDEFDMKIRKEQEQYRQLLFESRKKAREAQKN